MRTAQRRRCAQRNALENDGGSAIIAKNEYSTSSGTDARGTFVATAHDLPRCSGRHAASTRLGGPVLCLPFRVDEPLKIVKAEVAPRIAAEHRRLPCLRQLKGGPTTAAPTGNTGLPQPEGALVGAECAPPQCGCAHVLAGP